MNEIYAGPASQLQNFFLPTMKLKEKVREGARYTRKYDPPVTPYQRVLASDGVTDDKKRALRELKATLNPFALRREIEHRLKLTFNSSW